MALTVGVGLVLGVAALGLSAVGGEHEDSLSKLAGHTVSFPCSVWAMDASPVVHDTQSGCDLPKLSAGNEGLDVPLLDALADGLPLRLAPQVGATEVAIDVLREPRVLGAVQPKEESIPAVAGLVQEEASQTETLIRATFGEHGEEAVRVARCESGDDLHAEPWENPNHRGPFQISYVHTWRYERNSWDWDTATDAQHVMIAFELFQEQGWAPWACQP